MKKENVTIDIKNRTFGLKYCSGCHFFKPIRSHHCSKCDVCVEEFGKYIIYFFGLNIKNIDFYV